MIFEKKNNILILAVWFLLSGCASDQGQQANVLVQIGDKVITEEEFIFRSEYTIRPAWCRNDNYVHKKIALNSLIAEKLLALEAGSDTPVDNNPDIRAYLRGRKEQEMRQLYFQITAVEKVNADQKTLNTVLKNSERTYQVEIIPIGDDRIASQINQDLRTGRITFLQIKEQLIEAGGKTQELELRFDSPMDDIVYKRLFESEGVEKDQVIGPLQLDENAHTLIRINGWRRKPLMSDYEQKLRLRDVKEKVIRVAAMDIYVDRIRELMKGRQINFNKDVLIAVVEAVAPLYFEARKKSGLKMQKNFWQLENEEKISIDDIADKMDHMKSLPLLEIDGQVWTVGKFEEELKVHPLVFRNPKMSKSQFGEQFRLAIADMIRDRYITEDAYIRGYDKNEKLRQRYAMWEDNLKAEYMKELLLEKEARENKNDLKTVEDDLNPYVQSLFEKYSDQIEINTGLFESIELTDIDVFVIQENVPFPVYVPQFPRLTTHNRLDYGVAMQGD